MTINIAVIIPTHNRPESLKLSIESVLNQTYMPSEIIVVDDLNDNVIKELCNNFPANMVTYIPNIEGKGVSSSRNLGALHSKSEFIAFLDDDDVWLPEKLEKQCKLIENDNLDVCFSQLLIKYENTNISYATNAKNLPNPKLEILIENYIGGTISSVVRRSFFSEVGGFDSKFKAREEYDLWIRLVHAGAKIGIVEEPLAIAHRSLKKRDRISLNVNNYISAITRLNLKHAELVNIFLNQKQKTLRQKKQYDFIAAQAASIGLRKESVQYYTKSLFVRPSVKAAVGVLVSFISPKLLIKLREKLG